MHRERTHWLWRHAPEAGALVYLIAASAWIVGGDWLLKGWLPRSDILSWHNTGKGLLFAVVSMALVYALLRVSRSSTRKHLSSLRAAASSFRRTFDLHPVPMWLFSLRSQKILEVNQAAVQRYGFSREALLRMSIRDLRHPDQPAAAERLLLDATSDEQAPLSLRFIHQTAHGDPLPVLLRASDVDYLDEPARLVEASPISDLLSQEQEIARLREQLSSLQEVGLIATWQLDPQSGVITGAAAVEAGLNLPRGSFPADRTGLLEWVAPGSRQTLSLGLERVEEGRDALDIECPLAENGRHIRLQAQRVASEGASALIRGSTTDITELKRLEARLNERAERFGAVVEALPDAVLIIDAGRRVRFANAAARALCKNPGLPSPIGLPLDQVMGRSIPCASPGDSHEFSQDEVTLGERRLPCVELPLADGEEGLRLLLIYCDPKAQRIGEELHAANARLRGLSQRLVSMQEDERKRLARDLHDEVGQALAALSMHVDLMTRKTDDPEQLKRIARLREIITSALQQVRGMLLTLRPPQLDELGLGAALNAQLERIRDLDHLHIELDCPPLVPRPDPEIESVAFRIAQESLTNVVKHAQAGMVKVKVRSLRDLGRLEVDIIDDGQGFDAQASGKGRLGLLSMRERISLVGGDLEVESVRGLGTRIRASLPLKTPVEIEHAG